MRLLVATVISAQTTDVTVNKVTPTLFARYPDAAALAGADRDEMEAILKPTGFFRAKTDSVMKLGAALVERFDGQVPPRLADLVTLPGVGRKTANVVLGNAFDIPGITVDTHFGRLSRRFGWTEQDDPVKVEHEVGALFPKRDWTMLSHVLIFHGRRTCHAKKPACGACPVTRLCPAYGVGETDPERAKKAAEVRAGRRGAAVTDAVAPVPADWLERLRALPGSVRAEDLSSFTPPPEGGRESAVLVLVGQDDDGRPDVLLTERAADMRSHPGQVSFPGGSADPGDGGDPVATALREAHEETGLDPAGVEVLGVLPALFLPPSGFVVTPVLAWWRAPSAVRVVDPAECAAVVRVPVAELVDPANRSRTRHPSGYTGPVFEVRDLFVWGFTAGLLSQVLSLAGLDRPWDTSRFVPLPEHHVGARR
ncbi:hypothetical protein GCM10025868_17990 [Angustibacter aerolatus]|uniref:Endonuclease III n=1 Tax=Angustibacter aerolatus TaxID=1162965 RepID=A0ABQ6JFG7_9ACTN|nr:hypothetical protein GCM10025868_17990 [Angustibacter aerolatus]